MSIARKYCDICGNIYTPDPHTDGDHSISLYNNRLKTENNQSYKDVCWQCYLGIIKLIAKYKEFNK